MTRLVAAVSLLALLASPAAAYQVTPVGEPPAPEFVVSVTLSPIHLILPVFEVQAEVRVSERLGASLILGVGSVTITDGSTTDTFSVFEVGTQVAYDLVGDFDHGLQIGLEILYLGVSSSADSQFGGVFGRGLSVAPFVGYKVAASFGLTFVAQLGPAFMLVAAESDGESDSDSAIGAMLNLNLGWSF